MTEAEVEALIVDLIVDHRIRGQINQVYAVCM